MAFSIGCSVGESSSKEQGKGFNLRTHIKQRAIIELRDEKTGELKYFEDTHNIVTNNGLDHIVEQMADQGSPTVPKPLGMKLGKGTTNPAIGDNDVETAIAGSFKTFESGYAPNDDTTNNRTEWQSYWAAGVVTDNDITECVVKSADGTTDAVSRIEFLAVNKGASDTLRITIQWTFS